jgi:hypothetical protein
MVIVDRRVQPAAEHLGAVTRVLCGQVEHDAKENVHAVNRLEQRLLDWSQGIDPAAPSAAARAAAEFATWSESDREQGSCVGRSFAASRSLISATRRACAHELRAAGRGHDVLRALAAGVVPGRPS